jgi:flagellar biosynthesis/type III secretory pathway M-ring protein FliF/YscJ
MTALTKTLLAVGLTGMLAGIVIDFGNFNPPPFLATALPFGAVFFALFLICLFLGKVARQFDAEEAQKLQSVQGKTARPEQAASYYPATARRHA